MSIFTEHFWSPDLQMSVVWWTNSIHFKRYTDYFSNFRNSENLRILFFFFFLQKPGCKLLSKALICKIESTQFAPFHPFTKHSHHQSAFSSLPGRACPISACSPLTSAECTSAHLLSVQMICLFWICMGLYTVRPFTYGFFQLA